MILQPSEEAMTHAFIREIITGEQLKSEITQKKREMEAAQVAKEYRNKGRRKGAKMIHLAEIPQREYLQMIHKYGDECWTDREFIRDFQKHEPTMASNKISMLREI
jgi:hypothetical protein